MFKHLLVLRQPFWFGYTLEPDESQRVISHRPDWLFDVSAAPTR